MTASSLSRCLAFDTRQAFTAMSDRTLNRADHENETRKEEDDGERGARKKMGASTVCAPQILMFAKLASDLLPVCSNKFAANDPAE